LARTNYTWEKRQKELRKKKKQEEKRLRKQAKKEAAAREAEGLPPLEEGEPVEGAEPTTEAGEGDATPQTGGST